MKRLVKHNQLKPLSQLRSQVIKQNFEEGDNNENKEGADKEKIVEVLSIEPDAQPINLQAASTPQQGKPPKRPTVTKTKPEASDKKKDELTQQLETELANQAPRGDTFNLGHDMKDRPPKEVYNKLDQKPIEKNN